MVAKLYLKTQEKKVKIHELYIDSELTFNNNLAQFDVLMEELDMLRMDIDPDNNWQQQKSQGCFNTLGFTSVQLSKQTIMKTLSISSLFLMTGRIYKYFLI